MKGKNIFYEEKYEINIKMWKNICEKKTDVILNKSIRSTCEKLTWERHGENCENKWSM